MSLFSWGSSRHGATGATDRINREIPRAIDSDALRGRHLVQVACGERHTCCLDHLGNVICFGRNREGQCGVPEAGDAAYVPVLVSALAHVRIVRVSCSGSHTLAVADTGRLFQWGISHQRVHDSTPAYFGINPNQEERSAELMRMVDASHFKYYANATDRVEAVDNGLAHAQAANVVGAFTRQLLRTPTPVEFAVRGEEPKIVDAAAGYSFSLAVDSQGRLWSWGFNDKGQLGNGTRFMDNVPVPVTSDVRFSHVACGNQMSAALSEGGQVYTWGCGVFGLGHGDGHDQLRPLRVRALGATVVVGLSAGAHHIACVAMDGTVFVFGHGEYGQLATGDLDGEGGGARGGYNKLLPMQLDLTHAVRQISCGHLHTLALTDSGEVYSFGWGSAGALGVGDRKHRVRPTLIESLQGERVTMIGAGAQHSVALVDDGNASFAFDFAALFGKAKAIANETVVFVVEGKDIRVHRSIVRARSAVLSAMVAFTERFSRNNPAEETRIPISRKTARFVVFMGLCSYLYSDRVRLAAFFARELAELAHNWRMDRLEALARKAAQLNGGNGHDMTLSTFSRDLSVLLECGWHSDSDIVIDNQCYSAHSYILAVRCPYFRTLLHGPLQPVPSPETGRYVFSLDNAPFPAHCLPLVLAYVYANTFDPPSDQVCDLLAAADFFLISELKQLCEAELVAALDADNMLTLKEYAEYYNANRLCARINELMARGNNSSFA